MDIDGYAVPDCEHHTPTCPPDPNEESDPATWPAWTDAWHWEADEFDIISPDDLDAADAALADLAFPRLAGGIPNEDPGPTDADLRDFDEWLSQVDRPYPPNDQDPMAFPVGRPSAPMPDRYSPESLANIRRVLWS